jgi:hypothetical protein
MSRLFLSGNIEDGNGRADGSEASTMHTANRTEDNFAEGYETWLLQEAKQRNPGIVTYCLSWTTPAWTADGTSNSTFDNRTFMNSLGVGYHLRYLQQVKAQFNVSFDFAGVWK